MKQNVTNVQHHLAQYQKIITDLRGEVVTLKDQIAIYRAEKHNPLLAPQHGMSPSSGDLPFLKTGQAPATMGRVRGGKGPQYFSDPQAKELYEKLQKVMSSQMDLKTELVSWDEKRLGIAAEIRYQMGLGGSEEATAAIASLRESVQDIDKHKAVSQQKLAQAQQKYDQIKATAPPYLTPQDQMKLDMGYLHHCSEMQRIAARELILREKWLMQEKELLERQLLSKDQDIEQHRVLLIKNQITPPEEKQQYEPLTASLFPPLGPDHIANQPLSLMKSPRRDKPSGIPAPQVQRPGHKKSRQNGSQSQKNNRRSRRQRNRAKTQKSRKQRQQNNGQGGYNEGNELWGTEAQPEAEEAHLAKLAVSNIGCNRNRNRRRNRSRKNNPVLEAANRRLKSSNKKGSRKKGSRKKGSHKEGKDAIAL